MEKTIEEYLQELSEERPYKIVLSQPAGKETEFRKVEIRMIESKQGIRYQIEKFTAKQAFHINIEETDLQSSLRTYFGKEYLQCSAWTEQWKYQAKISKKGKLLQNRHRNTQSAELRQGNNKQKNYCIPEGTPIPPLVDMGIFTKEGKVVQSKYDKYRQINRFLEIVEDVRKELPEGRIHIIDFGCGKSYLTFLLYYYLVEVKHMDVTITGLDLKESVIRKCQEIADKYQYRNLHFEVGDIQGYQTSEPVNMVVSLHACDTATDYALYHAVRWNADVILSVPCCQHELNQQMQPGVLPILSRYGILKERSAALMTDAIRGNLLEVCGYRTQVMEFIDMEHSPKNLLIRAVRGTASEEKKQTMLKEAEALMNAFELHPTFYRLLKEEAGGRI